MSGPIPHYSHRSLVLCLMLLGLVVSSTPALAQTKPAVDGINGSLAGGYGYGEVASATPSAGGGSTFVPGETEQGWTAAGVLSFPIVDQFGGRAFVAGGVSENEREAGPGFAGSRADGVYGRAGLDLFYRNPETGFFGLGYRFALQDPIDPRASSDLTHGLAVDLGFYIPDNGLGPLDWGGGFTYGWGRVEGSNFGDDVARLEARFDAGWYWTKDVRFTPGFRWNREDPDISLGWRDLRGTAELAWLLPFGRTRYATLSAFGSGGKRRSELAAPYSDVDRTLWSVGGALSFNFPGAESLIQLKRERQ